MDVRAEAAPRVADFLTLLGVFLIGRKLGGYAERSWWWVLAPFWAPSAVLVVGLLILVGIFVPISAALSR